MSLLGPSSAHLLVLAPALAGAWAFWRGLSSRAAAVYTMAASLLSAFLSWALLAGDFRGVHMAWAWSSGLGVEWSWRLETETLALALLVSGIGALVLQYSGAYFRDGSDGGRRIALLAIFETAMLGLVLADNLYLLYVFWELTGICSFFLISGGMAATETSLRSARHALLVTVAGGLSLLAGFVYLGGLAGTSSLAELLESDLPERAIGLGFALILPAIVTKSAQWPTHFWLPGAMAAPTPVSAYLHSATMVKAGIVLLLYFYPLLHVSPLWTACLLPLGAVTCIWGSWRALGERDIKLLMAWSTVSQLGLLTLTIGLGTDLAIRAALLHVFAHAIFKAGLFLSVGAIDQSTGTRALPELGGLARISPWLTASAAILAGSMAGLPPLAGFLSKELILKKAMLTDPWTHGLAIGALILGSVGTVAYSSRFFFEVFTGAPRSAAAQGARQLPTRLLLAPMLLAGITLAAGPAAGWVDRIFLEPVAWSLVGSPIETKALSLWYGINATLLLSLTIVSVGFVTDRLLGLRFLGPRLSRAIEMASLFDRFMEGCQRIGRQLSRLLAEASPRTYLAAAIVLGLLPSLTLLPRLGQLRQQEASMAGLLVVAVLALLLAALLRTRKPLPRILILTAVGFAVALLFRLLNGPDLMLTQLLVETLLAIFFAFALWARPARRRGERRTGQGRLWRGALALASGLAVAALVPAMLAAKGSSHVADYVRSRAPVIADGGNLVNVVLTDVRALDTLMETVVVVLAALGIVGLLRGRERADETDKLERVAKVASPGLLGGISYAIIPIGVVFAFGLLLKGHNAPGGGFVAGLSLGVTAMLALLAVGTERLRGRLRYPLGSWAVFGCLVMLGWGAVGPLVERSALAQLHGTIPLFGTELPWHGVLLFDLGVAIAVGAGIGAAGLAFYWIAMRSGEARP